MPAPDCSGQTLPISRCRTGCSREARCLMLLSWLNRSAASPSNEDSSLRLGVDIDHDVSPEPFAQCQFDPLGDIVRLRHGQAGPQRAVDRYDHVLIEPADLHRVIPQDAWGGANDLPQLFLAIPFPVRS